MILDLKKSISITIVSFIAAVLVFSVIQPAYASMKTMHESSESEMSINDGNCTHTHQNAECLKHCLEKATTYSSSPSITQRNFSVEASEDDQQYKKTYLDENYYTAIPPPLNKKRGELQKILKTKKRE